MKVSDLIKILGKIDPNLEVYSYDEEGDFTAVQEVEVTPFPEKVHIHGGYP
jgi:hypothetical protein